MFKLGGTLQALLVLSNLVNYLDLGSHLPWWLLWMLLMQLRSRGGWTQFPKRNKLTTTRALEMKEVVETKEVYRLAALL